MILSKLIFQQAAFAEHNLTEMFLIASAGVLDKYNMIKLPANKILHYPIITEKLR